MFWVVNLFLKFIFILLSIAFVTLFERKVLGLSQYRLGPNKQSLKGIFQPILDGLKLFTKDYSVPSKSVYFIFFMSPIISFLVMMLMWICVKEAFMFWSMKFVIVYFMVCLGLSVYSILLSGWSSISKYASMGSVRSCSQSVSYEISMSLFFISFFMVTTTLKMNYEVNFGFFFLFFPILMVWFLSCLAETNRAPFDFSEGESELISGFNIEYGGSLFTFLFLAEYGMILFFCVFSSMLFWNTNFLFFLFYFFCFILVRSVFPRFRYDKLMKMTWFIFLPAAINYLLYLVLMF